MKTYIVTDAEMKEVVARIRKDEKTSELWLVIDRDDFTGGWARPILVDEVDAIREACERFLAQ